MSAAEAETGGQAAPPARWLGLAAAPSFAAMALMTATAAGGGDLMGMTMPAGSPLGGMVTMYLLMSAFHAAPWLDLIARRKGVRRR
jgi:hypothetical protein